MIYLWPLVALGATNDLTCSDVKSVYTTSKCCPSQGGSPDQAVSSQCDALTFGSTAFTGKQKYKWAACIDASDEDSDCPNGSRAAFREGLWKLRTEGKNGSVVSRSGTYAEQMYVEIEDVFYHEGKRSTLDSLAVRENYKDGKPFYTMPHGLTTAVAFLQQTWSVPMTNKIYPKLNDAVAKYIPLWSKDKRNANTLLRFSRNFGNPQVTSYTYEDFNAYGWLSVEDKDGGVRCVVATLPSNKTHDVVCGVEGATLADIPVKNGVLDVQTNPTVEFTIPESVRAALPAKAGLFGVASNKIFGIDLDLSKTDFATNSHPDDLASKQWHDKYTDDPTCALTMVTDIGNKASKYQGSGSTGYLFMSKVIQFCIRPQTTDATMRDLLTGKCGLDGYVGSAGFQIDYPARYQRIALAVQLNRDVSNAIRWQDRGVVSPVDGRAWDSVTKFSDAMFVREVSNMVLSFEPGTKFGGTGSDCLEMAAEVTTLLEDALTTPGFPTVEGSDSPDFAAFGLGTKKADGTDAELTVDYASLVRKYALRTEMGVDASEVFVAYDSVDDPRLDRTPDPQSLTLADGLNPQLNTTNDLRMLFGYASFVPLEEDRPHCWSKVWDPTTVDVVLKTFGCSMEQLKKLQHKTCSPFNFDRNTPIAQLPEALSTLVNLDFNSLGYAFPRRDGVTSPTYGSLNANIGGWKAAPFLKTTHAAMEALMKVLMNNGKMDDGTRIMPCAIIAMLTQPMDRTDEEVYDTSTYWEPLRSPQSDGWLSVTLGQGFSSAPSTLDTQLSTQGVGYGGVAYENEDGVAMSFSKLGQFYKVKASATVEKQPGWAQEAKWPGATFMYDILWRLRYAAHLCVPV